MICCQTYTKAVGSRGSYAHSCDASSNAFNPCGARATKEKYDRKKAAQDPTGWRDFFTVWMNEERSRYVRHTALRLSSVAQKGMPAWLTQTRSGKWSLAHTLEDLHYPMAGWLVPLRFAYYRPCTTVAFRLLVCPRLSRGFPVTCGCLFISFSSPGTSLTWENERAVARLEQLTAQQNLDKSPKRPVKKKNNNINSKPSRLVKANMR